jgi:hypothetical protein
VNTDDSDSLGIKRRPFVPVSHVVRFKTQITEAHAFCSRAGGALMTVSAEGGTVLDASVNGGGRD